MSGLDRLAHNQIIFRSHRLLAALKPPTPSRASIAAIPAATTSNRQPALPAQKSNLPQRQLGSLYRVRIAVHGRQIWILSTRSLEEAILAHGYAYPAFYD